MDANGRRQSQFGWKGRDDAVGFGTNGSNHIGEELPPLRAMAVGARPATLHFSTISQGEKLASPFLRSKNATESSLKSNNCSTEGGAGVRREWNECNWKVSVLNEVPLDFPLERTRREIENVPIADVVERITQCLRLLSIEAEFDGENAKAKCKTTDMVNFRIRLFAGSKSNTQEPIIVEIQRRSGSPRCFLSVCKKILDAAEGVEIQSESIPARKKMPLCMMKTPVSKMKCLQNIDKLDPRIEVISGISKSLEMLRSKKKDVSVLGLENLCFMTDPLKSRPDMAIIACKAMFVGEDGTEIRDEIEFMLHRDMLRQEGSHLFKGLQDKCHHLSLVLLSNVLALTSQDGCLVNAVENEKWFTEFLIPLLLQEVRSFEASSNNAYEAACGLASLATCSDFAKRVMMENSAVDDLHSANQFATYNHDLLESETRRSLSLLGHPV